MAYGYINDRTRDYSGLKAYPLRGASGPHLDKFDALNLHLRKGRLVTPGPSIVEAGKLVGGAVGGDAIGSLGEWGAELTGDLIYTPERI